MQIVFQYLASNLHKTLAYSITLCLGCVLERVSKRSSAELK